MNPQIVQQFELHVQRLVMPLLAFARRKRRMREELLAHLIAAYEEEFERRPDELAAAETALARLGDGDELRRQLQAVVPLFEQLFCWRLNPKEHVMSRWPMVVGAIGSFVGFAFLFGLALVMPATAKLANFEQWQTLPPRQQEAAQILKLALLGLLVLSAIVMFSGLGTLVYAFMQRRRQVG